MTDWQPIETAPKDGTAFLAYGRGSQLAGPLISSPYDQNASPMFGVTRWNAYKYDDYEPHGDGLFSLVSRERGNWMGGPSFPTHWMPLPEAPAIAMETQRAETENTGSVAKP